MKNPCKKCHWLKRLLCLWACQEYNDYANDIDREGKEV